MIVAWRNATRWKMSRIKIRKENSRIAEHCYPRWMDVRHNAWQIMRVHNFPGKPQHFGAYRNIAMYILIKPSEELCMYA